MSSDVVESDDDIDGNVSLFSLGDVLTLKPNSLSLDSSTVYFEAQDCENDEMIEVVIDYDFNSMKFKSIKSDGKSVLFKDTQSRFEEPPVWVGQHYLSGYLPKKFMKNK